MSDKRYQDCGLLEKLWRRRYYLVIPFQGISIWFMNKINPNEFPMTLKESFFLATGIADVNMNWLYSWEDVKKRLDLDRGKTNNNSPSNDN